MTNQRLSVIQRYAPVCYFYDQGSIPLQGQMCKKFTLCKSKKEGFTVSLRKSSDFKAKELNMIIFFPNFSFQKSSIFSIILVVYFNYFYS